MKGYHVTLCVRSLPFFLLPKLVIIFSTNVLNVDVRFINVKHENKAKIYITKLLACQGSGTIFYNKLVNIRIWQAAARNLRSLSVKHNKKYIIYSDLCRSFQLLIIRFPVSFSLKLPDACYNHFLYWLKKMMHLQLIFMQISRTRLCADCR